MSIKSEDSFSKETRKLRKKKLWTENEPVDFHQGNRRHKTEQNRRRMSTRSSSSSLLFSPTISYASVVATGSKNEKGKAKAISDNPGQDMEVPSSPIPQPNSIEDHSDDSIDGYDTDELLEKIEKLTPLQPLTTTSSVTRSKTKSKRRNRRTGGNTKVNQKRRQPKVTPAPPQYNHERTEDLKSRNPDTYWKYHADNSNMIGTVNEDMPITAIHSLDDQGPVLGMALSQDGLLLATFCTLGSVKIWDIQDEFRLLRKLRDTSEDNIDEFFCGIFQDQFILAGGKLKDRHRWSSEDDDCHILPCPIKIFDLEHGTVISRLEGHSEEILCIKSLKFDQQNYYITTSQDGYIFKWHVDSDWKTLIQSTRMEDGITCMAFTVSFIPHTGNKYFLGACDAHIRLYDFEEAQLLQTFEGIYSSYCDCGKFVKWLDQDLFMKQQTSELVEGKPIESHHDDDCDLIDIEENEPDFPVKLPPPAYFISRGAEMIDDGEVASTPNTCTLHRLIYPKKTGELFKLEEVHRFKNENYHSNSWLVKVASNGRYLFAPTMYGQLFIFNMMTCQLTAVIKEHEDSEVRDILIHPYFPLVFSCGDDGATKVYSYEIEDGVTND